MTPREVLACVGSSITGAGIGFLITGDHAIGATLAIIGLWVMSIRIEI